QYGMGAAIIALLERRSDHREELGARQWLRQCSCRRLDPETKNIGSRSSLWRHRPLSFRHTDARPSLCRKSCQCHAEEGAHQDRYALNSEQKAGAAMRKFLVSFFLLLLSTSGAYAQLQTAPMPGKNIASVDIRMDREPDVSNVPVFADIKR